MHTPFFSLIITTFNEGSWLQKTVDSIMSDEGFLDYEIIIVNDGSTDHSLDFLSLPLYKALLTSKKIQVVHGEHLGVARGRNRGAEEAQGDLFIFLDAHMEIVPGWLSQIKEVFHLHSEVDLLGISVYDINNPGDKYLGNFYTNKDSTMLNPGWILRDKERYPGLTAVPFITASNFIIKKEVFYACGTFPTYLRGWGPEDRSLCMIAYYLGYRTYQTPSIAIGHYFKSENTQEEKEKKADVFYNVLASAHILYPKIYRELVEYKLFRWNVLDYARSIMKEEEKEIRNYTLLLKKNRKKSFKDFQQEFSAFLDYFYVDAYEEGLAHRGTNSQKALEEFSRSLQLKESTPEYTKEHFHMSALYRIGQLHLQRTSYELAFQWTSQALTMEPDFIPALVQLSKILFEQQQYDRALSYCIQAHEALLLRNNTPWQDPLHKDNSLEQLTAETLDYLSLCYYYLQDYGRAAFYGKKLHEITIG